MKFSASRSLLHGTVGSGRTRIACSSARTCGSKSTYRGGSLNAALPDDLQVAALDLEHVEVGAEAARPVQPAARLGDEREPVPLRSASALSTSPWMNSSTSASCSGSAATKRAPTPDSEAEIVLCTSFARSIASRPVSLPEMRTT